MVEIMENNKNYKAGKKFDYKKNGGRDRKFDGAPKKYGNDTSRPRKESRNEYIEREEVNTEGLVVGRNAVRELLKSGREIDKLLVQRGEREGSIVVLVAEAINRGILWRQRDEIYSRLWRIPKSCSSIS